MTETSGDTARTAGPRAFVVMGVSGSGKTTIGRGLAEKLGCNFLDGDDFHTAENIRKMQHGRPLDDVDRAVWLDRLRRLREQLLGANTSFVLACSALKRAYRDQIRGGDPRVTFIYLRGSYELITARLRDRRGHFMPPRLLRSQLDTLEEPRRAIVVDIRPPSEELVRLVLSKLALLTSKQPRDHQHDGETCGPDQGRHDRPRA